MNKAKKNVVVVGFTKEEKNSIGLPSIENNTVHFVETMSEAIKYQGYLLIYDNKKNISLVEFDKKYRKSLQKFEVIWFYNNTYKWNYDKWSRITKVDRSIFEEASYSLGEEWDEYKQNQTILKEKIHFNKNKKDKLDSFYHYLKKYKTIKTEQIATDLNMNIRSIERYMQDLNTIYHAVGYDYSKKEWYFIW